MLLRQNMACPYRLSREFTFSAMVFCAPAAARPFFPISAGLKSRVPHPERMPRPSRTRAIRIETPLSEFEFAHRVLAQPGLLHLAARRHADRLEVRDDPQVARHAEVGAFLFRPRYQLGFCRSGPRFECDVCTWHLAQPGVGDADHLR